ncbi:hypothetical protein Goklo_025316, partial [Gossypium klotzschianum]|nr:hypothetical protein [Gossypium klotzschianum]
PNTSLTLGLSRYVLVYFSVLYLRYHAGIVTDEMLSMPKAPFLAVGLLEALGAATGMAAGGHLCMVILKYVCSCKMNSLSIQKNEPPTVGSFCYYSLLGLFSVGIFLPLGRDGSVLM